MWIRSQCRKILQEIDFLVVERVKNDLTPYLTDNEKYQDNDKYAVISYVSSHQLGIYSTEEKAMKSLDMIQRHILVAPKVITQIGKNGGGKYNVDVFQMPQDDEVII